MQFARDKKHAYTHTEIFSKSSPIKPKSDCIYHIRIDLEHLFVFQRLIRVPNEPECGKYALIWVAFNAIFEEKKNF